MIPRSRSKAEDRKKEKNDGNTNGQATHGARKPPWQFFLYICEPKESHTQIFSLKFKADLNSKWLPGNLPHYTTGLLFLESIIKVTLRFC